MNSFNSAHEVPKRLSDVVKADGFATRVLDVIERVDRIQDESDMLELLREARLVLGAEQAVFASYIREDMTRDSLRVLVAADPAWCPQYTNSGWYAKDPWLLYAMRAAEPATDLDIPIRTPSQRDARALAAEHGVASAYIVPAHSGNGVSRVGVLVLTSSVPDYFQSPAIARLRVFAQGFAMDLHAWWVRRMRQKIIQAHRVSHEDIELIKMERDGLGSKEIASRLNINASTVDTRFHRLTTKFNQPNRRALARMAAEYGLLEE